MYRVAPMNFLAWRDTDFTAPRRLQESCAQIWPRRRALALKGQWRATADEDGTTPSRFP
jgi:hypothetical protein